MRSDTPEAAGDSGNRPQRLHAYVEGRVQGVGFRYFVLDEARKLGVRGWVRNRHDGRVELMAEGSRASLRALLSQVERGPRAGRVDKVDSVWEEAGHAFEGFRLESTA